MAGTARVGSMPTEGLEIVNGLLETDSVLTGIEADFERESAINGLEEDFVMTGLEPWDFVLAELVVCVCVITDVEAWITGLDTCDGANTGLAAVDFP